MRNLVKSVATIMALGAALAPPGAQAYTSGSTGADGAFNPTVNTTVDLPPSGILNYTSVLIPAGVTVLFRRNVTNTPVVLLATGDVTINGTININGSPANNSGAAGTGNLGDDGVPGVGGPGGYDGGRGGVPAADPINFSGGNGLGPGGGARGVYLPNNWLNGGGGGGFGAAGANVACTNVSLTPGGLGGPAYGTSALIPLIGGSGGGGGSGGSEFRGAGGGGGAGAILIAASGTVTITGTISAIGGSGGNNAGPSNTWQPAGGGGSGGAIRIVATGIVGNGTLAATGGAGGTATSLSAHCAAGGAGSVGRIRLEAETITRTATSNPTHTFAAPSPAFLANTPTLKIASVAGVNAPDAPNGSSDITLPANTPNPVTINLATTGVPVGNTVSLTVTPQTGAPVVVVSPALTGTTANATASVQVTLPTGPSVLRAQTTYTVLAAVGDALRNFANNERVEKITLSATMGGESRVTLVTVSGKEYDAPADALRIAMMP